MRIGCALFTLGFIFSTNAYADLYLEPYVGYSIGNESTDINATIATQSVLTSTSGTNGQVLYGGRLGYSASVLALGGEYFGGTVSTSESGTISTAGVSVKASSSGTTSMTNLGVFVAANLPIIRAFATYFPSAKLDSGSTSGHGFKIGVGCKVIPLIAINAEYMNFSYDTYSESGSTINSFSSTMTGYMLSVSVPLSL